MKRLIIAILSLILILLLPAKPAAAQTTLPSGVPDADIGRVMEAYIAEHEEQTAAVSVAVFRGDETLYRTDYGFANIEQGVPADEETVYEWGSVGKLLVWVSVMQLWEAGEIDLEADIRTYLPSDFLRLQYDEPVTMLNLMNHNAGFEDTVFGMSAPDEAGLLPLDEAPQTTHPVQVNRPGEVTAYSNWTTALAGYIVARVSGMPYYEYVHQSILRPLGMDHTGIDPSYIDNPWVKEQLLANEGYADGLEPMADGLFYLTLYPAGSAAGTLDDIVTFAKALVPGNSGAQKLFEHPETLTEMLSPTLSYPGTDIDYVNHGLWSHEYAVQALGHGGNSNMYSSYLLIDPVGGTGLAIMTNQGSEITYNYGLPPLVFGELGAVSARADDVPADGSVSPDIGGLYYNARTTLNGIGKMYTVISLQPYRFVDDGIRASFFGTTFEGRPIAPDTFTIRQSSGSYEVYSLARYAEVDGRKTLTSPYGQSIEADLEVWLVFISTLLLVLAVIWSALVLIINLVRFIVRKVRQGSPDPFKPAETIVAGAVLAQTVNIMRVGNKMMQGAPESAVNINLLISVILAVIPVIYAVLLNQRWVHLERRAQRVSYMFTLFAGLFMSLSVLVLEMYKL